MNSTFIRWSGLAALVGGLLSVGLDLWDFLLNGDQLVSVTALNGSWIVLHASYLAADLLILLALVGMWLVQAAPAGALGVVGFLMAFAGTVMLTSLEWSTAFLFPWVAASAPGLLDSDPTGSAIAGFIVTVLLAMGGWLIFAVASLRAGVLPRGPVWLLVAGTITVLVLGTAGAPFLDVVWGLGLAWIGYTLWSGTWQAHTVAAAT